MSTFDPAIHSARLRTYWGVAFFIVAGWAVTFPVFTKRLDPNPGDHDGYRPA